MRRLSALAIIACLWVTPAFAQAERPWEKAGQVVDAAMEDVKSGGLLGVRPHVSELEQSLAGAPAAFEIAAKGDGDKRILLADGPAETLLLLTGAAADNKGSAIAVANPYPSISFLLGSYYLEIERPADAVRVLSAGLALPSSDLGQTQPMLRQERGTALLQTKQLAEALADFDAGLKLPNLNPALHARYLRGRGAALTDLGRLDEAEASYRESLTIVPNNPIAINELKYIAGLRAGAKPTDIIVNKVQKSAPKE